MKFASVQDTQLFLVEIGRLDLLTNVTESFQPDESMINEFVKKRQSLIPGLRDFRKSQVTKQQWRKNRYNLMKGIKRFHRSTKGKRMHRQIGRFLATRDFTKNSIIKRESLSIKEVNDFLVGLSSLKTHNYVELRYYMSLEEHLEYQDLSENIIIVTSRIEEALFKNKELDSTDLNFLTYLVDSQVLVNEICKECNCNKFVNSYKFWENSVVDIQSQESIDEEEYLKLISSCRKTFIDQ